MQSDVRIKFKQFNLVELKQYNYFISYPNKTLTFIEEWHAYPGLKEQWANKKAWE